MCGFAGILNNDFFIHKKQMAAIASKVSSRGPDSCGIQVFNKSMQPVEEGVHALFFNRLAILDLDHRSDQPFENERYVLIFNGEIYNYKALKQELSQKGYQFHTTSDTEVLFYALQNWGSAALEKLNGIFAFCFIDKHSQKFIVAKDRLGVKPLYYQQLGSTFVFGSDLDSVLRLSSKQQAIDVKALQMYLWMQFIPTPFTGIKGCYKLPPGHFIEGTIDALCKGILMKPEPFWDAFSLIEKNKTAPSQLPGLEDVLVDTLQRQLVADVPLGLFLSSGVDSSLLAALVNKHFAKGQYFNFFTVAFSEATTSDESNDAIDYIKSFKNPFLVNHTLTIDSSYIGDHLDKLYEYVDEPFGDPTILLNWVISKKAKEHVTVAISGDGADELFWGYDRYNSWQEKRLNLAGGTSLKGTSTTLAKYFLPTSHHRSLAALASEPDNLKRHFTFFLHPSFASLQEDPVYNQNIWALKGVESIKNRDDLTAILDIKTYLADAMLYKVDRSSMAASLEVRVPYLDNKVVDYALAMPLKDKSTHDFKNKAPLKRLLLQLAPHYNISQPKKGFNFPLDQWVRFAWKDFALSLFSEQAFEETGLDGKQMMNLISNYYKGNKRNTLPVWYLLNLIMWKQKLRQITPLQKS